MKTNNVERAEQVSNARAILFFLMAACLILSSMLGTGRPQTARDTITWLVLATITALNLTGIGGWLHPRAVMTLVNDDGTREHRRLSFTVGYWAMTICSLILFAVTTLFATDITAGDAARIITSAGLASALISFAAFERRAAR